MVNFLEKEKKMRSFCFVLLLILIATDGGFGENANNDTTLLSEGQFSTFVDGEHSTIDDPSVFEPMEDMDEEAIDAYCVDISNDCEEREHFCQNPAFHETMLERCPRTCNFCKELISRRTTPTDTVEEEDYNLPTEIMETQKPIFTTQQPPPPLPTPASHEEADHSISLKQLVGSAENHIIDIEAMESTTKRTKKLRARRVCRDLASDCNTKLRLCSSTFYSTIMERFCQKSCNFCNESNRQNFKKYKTLNRSKTLPRNRSTIRQTVTTADCIDIGIDCNEKRSLCSHRSYTKLMTSMCPLTCNMCETADR